MSDPIDPATIGVALDEAEANGLHPEFTALLKAMVGKADLLERAVVLLERRIKSIGGLMPIRPPATGHPEVALVAEHRGETPAATLARLSPNPHHFETTTTPVRPRDGRPFTEAEMDATPPGNMFLRPGGQVMIRRPDGIVVPYSVASVEIPPDIEPDRGIILHGVDEDGNVRRYTGVRVIDGPHINP